MAFQEIKPVESGDFYLDLAIKKANRKAKEVKFTSKENKFQKIKSMETLKIDVVRNTLIAKLDDITQKFPKTETLTEFYKELVEATIGVYELRRVLERISWTSKKIQKMHEISSKQMKAASNLDDVQYFKKQFYGRAGSVMSLLNKDLEFLKKARQSMQSFPVIKTKLKQIAIAGFPNVGKTTLLSKLSGSTPEIASYAFTTKKTMIGYVYKEGVPFAQLLDTPGTLNRFNKMNYIEQQAFLVLKMIAEKIVYIFDLTEPFPIEEQEKLYEKIKELGKPVVVYLSKLDIITDSEKVKKFREKYNALNLEELKEEILE